MSFVPRYGVNYNIGTEAFPSHHDRGLASDENTVEATNDNFNHLFESPAIVPNDPAAQNFHQVPSVGLAIDNGASHGIANLTQTHSEALHPCPACGKQFPRKCDLNKHFKTHSRRYKCDITTCPYSEQGFPTQKELERHINDKHTPDRKVFSCYYPSCDYKSPRESNCKAHMEKAHGYHYVRTRSRRSYRCPFEGCNDCLSEEDTRQRHAQVQSTVTSPMYPRYTRGDFVLYPDLQNPNLLSYAQTGMLSSGVNPQPASPDSYLPWTSPATRLQNVETNIQRVDDTIRPEDHGVPISPFPLDPQLFQAVPNKANVMPNWTPTSMEEPPRIFSVPGYARVTTSGEMMTSPVKPWADPQAYVDVKGHVNMAARPAHPSRHSGYLAVSEAQHVPSNTYGQTSASPERPALKLEDSDNDESSHDEEEPPQKKPKASHGDEAEDDKVPCPFRENDPRHFSRDNNEKFSPCHSKHESIASLVRHLKRPAHRLKSERKFISSFDVDDEGRGYPRAGLCKRCWKPFTDEQLFNEHLQQNCAKSSRGKREKYNLLRDTFVTGSQSNRDSLGAPSPLTGWQATDEPEEAEYEAQQPDTIHVASAHNPSPSIGVADNEAISRVRHLEEKLVALTQRVEALEQERQNTAVLSGANLLPQQLGLAETATSLVAHASSTPRAARSIVSSVMSREPGTDETIKHPRHQTLIYGASSRQRDLVGGMDSYSIDVDRETTDFFHEAARTLSGLSSSSDRSSVRHVPPPTLDKPGESSHANTSRERKRRRIKTPSPQKMAPSLTDSGYASKWRTAETINEDDDEDEGMSDVDEEDDNAEHETRQDEEVYRLSQSDFQGTTLSPDQVASMFR